MSGARRPLGVAFLSAIRHGSNLAPCFARDPDARLVAIADDPKLPEPWRDTNPRLAETYGIPYVEDVDDVLARPDVDTDCIAADCARHGRLAQKALEAGKHVLLDRPMAITLEKCRRVAEAAERAARRGVKTLTVSRFASPSVQRALEVVRSGRIGDVRSMRAEFVASYGPGEKYDSTVDISWSPRFTGGGEILNFALHPLTNVRTLVGREIESVQNFGGGRCSIAHTGSWGSRTWRQTCWGSSGARSRR